MKFILIVLITLTFTSAKASAKHLFILSGQSNMQAVRPHVSFIPRLTETLEPEQIIVVKDAHSGQPIYRWYKKWLSPRGEIPPGRGELYDRLMNKVNKAIANQEITSITFLWMQGERDALMKWGNKYKKSLRGLLSQLRQDLDWPKLNFVIGRLSDFDMENKKYPHWTKVRESQVRVAESSSRGAWVNTDDLNNPNGNTKNNLHYTAKGYIIFGQRLAEKALNLIDLD